METWNSKLKFDTDLLNHNISRMVSFDCTGTLSTYNGCMTRNNKVGHVYTRRSFPKSAIFLPVNMHAALYNRCVVYHQNDTRISIIMYRQNASDTKAS